MAYQDVLSPPDLRQSRKPYSPPYGDPLLARATVERVTSPGEVRDLVLGGTMGRLLGIL
ncbi:hypothetical protein OHA77_35930 [Streptosporangium sp. NBC_01639]|uniref:hypothetical protein n=1 Tax=Streptosporangium sp. NBC_01639 TaxID=2975948 RepID=UPI00386D04B2|nr:hypothetical protein OHA77_35930 [Streptosporangium sp. NBC_01639]